MEDQKPLSEINFDTGSDARHGAHGVRGVVNDIGGKPSTARTDPEIARDAIHELESHVSIPVDKINVSGWATLEGTVDWQFQKTLAESA